MYSSHGIKQLHELASCISDDLGAEELPKKLVYVYYCEVCNSILALQDKLVRRESFLYAAEDSCPTCDLRLEISLRCRALKIPMPVSLFKPRPPLKSSAPSCLSNFISASLPNSNVTPDSIIERRYFESSPLSHGESLLDQLCGDMYAGQLILIYGDAACQKAAARLCVRSQLPTNAEGFGVASVFLDGGNIFDVYQVSSYAALLHLDRDDVLRSITISRAFTCYQLVNLIVEKLPELLSEERARLVVIANILDLFLDPEEIDFKEAKQTVNFLSRFLARFASENNVAVVATCPVKKGDALLRQFLASRAQVVLKAEQRTQNLVFTLEKHQVSKMVAIDGPALQSQALVH